MNEQWEELKETIIELRDNNGTGTQQEVCGFLANLMNVLEKQIQEPYYDVISRQAVLDGIDTYINKAQSTGTQDDFYSFAELVVKDLPPVTPKQKIGRWIPVSERLPEEWESVLVCLKTQGGMAQAVSERFDGDKWTALCGMKPIAWMPLPEPYKESEG